jgi:hypothetical protein
MNKNKFLWLFVLCCAVPLLAAKVVLELGWYQAGVGSQGDWQRDEVFLLPASAEKAHWRLAVAPAGDCQQQCQQALYTVQQLYVGLGRKQEQVQPVLLSETAVPADYPLFTRHRAVSAVPQALQNRILLIDHQGLVLLSYTMPSEDDMAATAKAIRQDLLKLLNYDRTSV